MKTLEQIKNDVESQTNAQVTIESTALIVPKEKIQDVARFLKANHEYQMDYVSCVTGVDYKEHLEVVYHLYSTAKKEGAITLKVRTTPADPHIPSVTPIWRGAEYQEREAYDLVGIHFDGHPDLRRILMWEGFEHHPLRKDYVQDDQDREPANF